MNPPAEFNPQQSGLTPTIQNIVCTVNLGLALDLKSIAQKAWNVEYNPKKFAAVTMRIREPKTTALIFASGKIVCTGAKSEYDAKKAGRKYARIVQKVGYPDARFKNFGIQNVVGSCDMKFPVRLEVLCANQQAFAKYEPEIFPGLTYRMKKPNVTISVFVSGKVVITGAKSKEEVLEAFENIYPIMNDCRRDKLQ